MKTKPCCNIMLSCILAASLSQTLLGQAFYHPGCLEEEADFSRMYAKVQASQSPWIDSYNKLAANAHAQTSWTPSAVPEITRGSVTGCAVTSESYKHAEDDAAAAYSLALRWKCTGDTSYANAAINTLNAWPTTCTNICGDSNAQLAAGLQGYEFACAAEIMRTYSGWSSSDFTKFKNFMLNVFYPANEHYITTHNGTCISHYWCNWDLCNIASIMAIGILCDDRAKYNEALNYWKTGPGNGEITNAVPFVSSGYGQGQEEGRDQGHSGLDTALEGVICTMAFHQGDDLFGYSNNRVLAMCEYFARYNLGNAEAFYNTYNNCDNVNQTVISSSSRGDNRPSWDLIYNYYYNRALVNCGFSSNYCFRLRPEGGNNDYGTSSGAYDQLGYTTLTESIDRTPLANGKYYIISVNSGKYLDDMSRTTNGSPVGQWTSNSSNNQKWNITYAGGGYYSIQNVANSLYLDNLGSGTDGAVVAQWSNSGSRNQRWMLVPIGSGHYKIIDRYSGKNLDNGGQSGNGASITQWHSDTLNNQQWSFTTAP